MLWRRNIKYYTSDLKNTEKKKKDFFAGGFGFASRDGNKGMDLVLPWVGLVLPWVSSSSSSSSFPSFFFFSFFLLCSSSSFLRSVRLNRVHETQVLRV